MDELTKWINNRLPDIVNNLEKNTSKGSLAECRKGVNIASREKIFQVLDQSLAVLFPGVLGDESVLDKGLNLFIGDHLRSVVPALTVQIEQILCYVSEQKGEDPKSNLKKARVATYAFAEELLNIRKVLLTDVGAAYEGDPAAISQDEVLMSYPCIEAIATFRIAHQLYLSGVPIIPRIMTERAHSRTGIDIHPGATIGSSFFIDHGTGVVIGETTIIGKRVKLYQGVTLGALSFPKDKDGSLIKGVKRHPNIEDNVVIYAGATVLGGETTIGKNSIIGGNSWVTSSVEANTIVKTETSRSKIQRK